MTDALGSHTESGTNLYGFCTKHHRCCKSSSVCNTTSCDYRNLHCINDLRNQCHGCRGSDMTTGLCSLSNNRIRTGFLHHFCKSHTCNNRNNFDSGSFPHFHVFTRITGTGCNNLDTFLHNNMCYLFRIRAKQHNIYTKRLICQFLCFANLCPNHIARRTCRTDQTKTTRIGNCCRQMIICYPGHTALNDRIFNSKKFCNSCFHLNLFLYTMCFQVIDNCANCCKALKFLRWNLPEP